MSFSKAMNMRPIAEHDVNGKTVLFRAGIDLPIDMKKRIVVTRRLTEDAGAIKQLAGRGARVVVLAHQGRPGKSNFLHLDQHAEAMSRLIGVHVKFLDWYDELEKEIQGTGDGSVILLDNTRMRDDEDIKGADAKRYAETGFVQSLSKVADIYVNNALSVSHRTQASVIGFPAAMPAFAGPTLLAELAALDKARQCRAPRTLILGGAKLKDALQIMSLMLGKGAVENVLLGGLMGELFVKASGISLGEKEHMLKSTDFFEYIKDAKAILEKYRKKISMPIDFGCGEEGKREEIMVENLPTALHLKDIGTKTALNYADAIANSRSVIWEGPLGVYEEKGFVLGTAKVAQAIVFSDAYSVVAGGDTEAAISAAGISLGKFSHVSLSGKACMLYLAGEKLPGLEALEQGAEYEH